MHEQGRYSASTLGTVIPYVIVAFWQWICYFCKWSELLALVGSLRDRGSSWGAARTVRLQGNCEAAATTQPSRISRLDDTSVKSYRHRAISQTAAPMTTSTSPLGSGVMQKIRASKTNLRLDLVAHGNFRTMRSPTVLTVLNALPMLALRSVCPFGFAIGGTV